MAARCQVKETEWKATYLLALPFDCYFRLSGQIEDRCRSNRATEFRAPDRRMSRFPAPQNRFTAAPRRRRSVRRASGQLQFAVFLPADDKQVNVNRVERAQMAPCALAQYSTPATNPATRYTSAVLAVQRVKRGMKDSCSPLKTQDKG